MHVNGGVEKLKIGVVAPEFPPAVGGVERYSAEYARELARRGHEVTVLTVPHRGGEIRIPGVEIVPRLRRRLRLDRRLVGRFQPHVWHVMTAAYSWLALEMDNVLVSVHGNDFLSASYALQAPNLMAVPGLWRWQSRLQRGERAIGRWRSKGLIERSLPRAAHIVANSRYTERVLLERIPECQGRTSVGFVGVSRSYLEGDIASKETRDRRRLVTVTRLSEPRKNVDRVMRALAQLKDRWEFEYLVIGDGPRREELEELSRRLGLWERVRFTGRVDDATLREVLSASGLFVLPSSALTRSHEGFGIVYLEAAACGTPSLAARAGGAAEAIDEGVTGYFVEQPTEKEIGAAIEQFLRREVTFEETACRAFARRFTWARVVDHALAFYPQAIERSRGMATAPAPDSAR